MAMVTTRMRKKQKLIVITGPTASGKSELAVALAKKFGGEIISADSRQIYKHLTLGVAKIPGRWRQIRAHSSSSKKQESVFMYRGIAHHCIDCVPPRISSSVAAYQACARRAISAIARRGKVPILAGGTGFWIDAVVFDLALPVVLPNDKLRARLEQKNCSDLLRILARKDPTRARNIDPHNPRRLIRAIEIAAVLGSVPRIQKRNPYSALWIGIRIPPTTLRNRINRRLMQHLRAGMIAEVRRLRARGMPWKRLAELGLEYRIIADFLHKKITRAALIPTLERALWNYARRQLIWFRRNPAMHWIATSAEAQRLIADFLQNKNASHDPIHG